MVGVAEVVRCEAAGKDDALRDGALVSIVIDGMEWRAIIANGAGDIQRLCHRVAIVKSEKKMRMVERGKRRKCIHVPLLWAPENPPDTCHRLWMDGMIPQQLTSDRDPHPASLRPQGGPISLTSSAEKTRRASVCGSLSSTSFL